MIDCLIESILIAIPLIVAEQTDRARKNAENELADASTRINELTITVTSLTGDKRRMEADFQSMHADLDEAIRAKRAAEERADRFQIEVNRLTEELRQEQENYRNAESLRKQLEVEIREITVRLEEAEAFAQKEGKRLIAKLQAKVGPFEDVVVIRSSWMAPRSNSWN